MEISSLSNSAYNRAVTPSKSGSDRQSNDAAQATATVEAKSRERAEHNRAVQEKLQQANDEQQRRLDGRLVSFGSVDAGGNEQAGKASYNRERINEAYSAPKQHDVTHSEDKHSEQSNNRPPEAIDIVV